MKEAFIELIKNLADLFKVKTILSLSVITTICILTFKGVIQPTEFMVIASGIITYYFTKKESN
jgi:hypothetical protein